MSGLPDYDKTEGEADEDAADAAAAVEAITGMPHGGGEAAEDDNGTQAVPMAVKVPGYRIPGQRGLWRRVTLAEAARHRRHVKALFNDGESLGRFVPIDSVPKAEPTPLLDLADEAEKKRGRKAK